MDIRIRFRIHQTRGAPRVFALLLALLVLAAAGYLAVSQNAATASAPVETAPQTRPSASTEAAAGSAVSLRKFYLTKAPVLPVAAPAVCGAGYHFAALWEIADVTNLRYETTLGLTTSDSGQGPPAAAFGWVRTGTNSAAGTAPGMANCLLWTTVLAPPNPGGGLGTVVALPDNWTAGDQDMGVWEAAVFPCSAALPVWCAEDFLTMSSVYLPYVSR